MERKMWSGPMHIHPEARTRTELCGSLEEQNEEFIKAATSSLPIGKTPFPGKIALNLKNQASGETVSIMGPVSPSTTIFNSSRGHWMLIVEDGWYKKDGSPDNGAKKHDYWSVYRYYTVKINMRTGKISAMHMEAPTYLNGEYGHSMI